MKRLAFLLATVLAVPAATFAYSQSAEAASVTGDQILEAVDKRAAAFPDQTYTAVMEVWRDGSKQKTLEFDMKMKDMTMQFISFTKPGDVAGMKILMTDPDTIYMYSPEFKKVRRIAAHTKSQGFLGSEFTPEDMSQTNLSKLFNARLDGKSGTETTLTLTPKEGVESTFSKIELVIDSSKGGVTTLRYFDGAGNHVRTQSREGWTTIKDQPFPTTIRMKNLKTGAETVIQLTDIDVDTVVDDSLFSRRTLLRG
ncbi:MAG: outer membrane lipoprotein-sorting protein [Myxococcales bacterium]|nr:outer membrane lipoprotein-sorting protein [Myxococcales bacterium]MCB9755683.1 outer membrane lipoprotein-sorting protein [Myxococcales bacterium]